VFKTRDGHINIATAGTTTWERLCRAIGAESLMQKARVRDLGPPAAQNRDALNAEIEGYLDRPAPAPSGSSASMPAEVPCGPIYAIDEIYSDPQVEHLQIVHRGVDVETPDRARRAALVGPAHDAGGARRAALVSPAPARARRAQPRRCCASFWLLRRRDRPALRRAKVI
jgi:crotonobetainyl-CoA:carnitine CoA-transferase CaiB-like acyl-CoA transferase